MSFLYRSHRGSNAYLAWKVRTFWLGAALGLLGIWLESPWLVGPAVAVLLAGVLLRFLPAHSRRAAASGEGGPPAGRE